MEMILLGAALLTAAAAAVTDVRTGRVPNRLILAALSAALIIRPAEALAGGLSLFAVLCDAAAGAVIPLIFPGILFPLRMMGGGDIKLLCAIGALLGRRAALRIIPASFFAGAVQALILLALRRDGRQRLKVLGGYVNACIRAGRALPYPARNGGGKMHFTLSIAAALIWYVLREAGSV